LNLERVKPLTPVFETALSEVASLLKAGERFLLVTHQDPDADGIGSMLALGSAMAAVGKDVVLLTKEPLYPPLNQLKGSEKITQNFDLNKNVSAVVALDCSEINRIGIIDGQLENFTPLVNIDHHRTNELFGDLNLIDAVSSSTGEIVLQVIETAGFPINKDIAENIFAAIQTDTGSFSYDNTTPSTYKIAARMMEYGVKPWDTYRKLMKGYGVSRLKLLSLVLGTLEFLCDGRVGILVVTSEMIEKIGAIPTDSERFVDYPRFVAGVEIGVLIRQTNENDYKFSLRSNGAVDVANLAGVFGGGGHSKAAGFKRHGDLDAVKSDFIKEVVLFLDGKYS
jgi:phosphoesterase RecJ-like protein